MRSEYSRSPKLLKGAFVQIPEDLLVPIPNIIIFQYNPDTLTRTLGIWTPPAAANANQSAPTESAALTAQPEDPRETLSLSLELDATDALEQPASHPVAAITGIGDRLAALEMLIYPQESSGLAGLVSDAASSLGLGGVDANPERKTVAPVFFVWGPGKIIPVRISTFSIEEQAFSTLLYPIRAKVTVELKILFPQDFPSGSSFNKDLAEATYLFYKKQKQVLASANLANSVESILGMLPF